MDPAPTTGGALLMTEEFRPGPLDQTAVEAREDVLVFTTEPLAEDLEVTGRVRAVLFAATDGPSTDWVARHCDVDENGVSLNVADGIVRVRAAAPGEAAEHVVDLWSTSIVFRAGHRIRVQVLQQLPVLGPQPQHGRPRRDRDHGPGGPPAGLPRPRPAVPHRPAGNSGPMGRAGDPRGGGGRPAPRRHRTPWSSAAQPTCMTKPIGLQW
ncbi:MULTISPECIES: CocE/NonD family hydrolase [unclassified Streptomyces]|uniref:CocE/NonD family hydrolase n=1 Tax=unclassified Streptomyces TaxID=2593676 RepID=UPI0037F85DC3